MRRCWDGCVGWVPVDVVIQIGRAKARGVGSHLSARQLRQEVDARLQAEW